MLLENRVSGAVHVQEFSYLRYILCDTIELHTFYFEVPDSLVSRFVLIVHPLAIGDSIETVFGWRIRGTSIPVAAVRTRAMVIKLIGRTWTGSTNIICTFNESSS